MRVCYLGRRSARTTPEPSVEGDVLELLWDAWDDFGFQTAFGVTCRINSQRINLGGLRLLVSEGSVSRHTLDELRANGWDGNFPAPDIKYISVPTAITFYQQLKVLLGADGAKNIANALHDASYMVATMEDESAMELANSGGFLDSLLREQGSRTAYDEGWKILDDQDIAVQNFQFNFKDVYGEKSTLSLNFDSGSVLPHEINVLIGPNGAGKSQILHQMVRAWIRATLNKSTNSTDQAL